MAQTADHISQAPPAQPDEPHCSSDHRPVRVSGDIDRDAREDTELARLRRNYSRASSHRPQAQGSSTVSRAPSTVLGRLSYIVSRSWRHQVSITVEHSTCRDHLGMSCEFFPPAPILELKPSISVLPVSVLGSPIPNCQCIKSSGILTAPFHHTIRLQTSIYWTIAKTLF